MKQASKQINKFEGQSCFPAEETAFSSFKTKDFMITLKHGIDPSGMITMQFQPLFHIP